MDFRNTIIIMTSNVGSRNVVQKSVQVGYSTVSKSATAVAAPQCEYRKALEQTFAPEFLNRIDDIVVFHQLTQDEIIQMVDLMLARVETALRNKDMAIEVTDKAKSLLAKRGFDPVLGARPLRRTIQREIEDQLSEKILFGEVEPGQIVLIDVENWDGEGEGEDAKFTFVGSEKPRELPDAPVELSKSGDA